MTQEDKELLLKDICARLFYGLKCLDYKNNLYEILGCILNKVNIARPILSDIKSVDVELIKPYLRPLSSMTEEERNEYLSIKMQEMERVALAEVDRPEAISEIMDWLNAHHFDYRGLIEKSLAIEAPEGMYN